MHAHFLFLILTFLWLFNPPAIAQEAGMTNACSERSGTYAMRWTRTASSIKLPARSGQMMLPKQYEVFEVTATNLKSNLTLLRKKGGYITLPFVDPAGKKPAVECLRFKVENSGVMPDALNDKYPGIVSLKGTETTIQSNTIRFDYDGSNMNISITRNGVNYLYSPYKVKKKTYYLLYKKSDYIASGAGR